MPPRVSRFSAKAEPVNRSPPPRPIERRPRLPPSPPSRPTLAAIGPAPAPIIGPAAAAIGLPAAVGRPPASPGIPTEATPAAGEPPIGAWRSAPPGCAPPEAPSWLRKLSAMTRSMPRRSSRPATSPRKPGSRGAAIRSSTCSTTCTAAVRPNRASSARGSGWWFLIVPVASLSVSRPREAFDSVCGAPHSRINLSGRTHTPNRWPQSMVWRVFAEVARDELEPRLAARGGCRRGRVRDRWARLSTPWTAKWRPRPFQ